MRIELEPAWYSDHVYRMADLIGEGLSSIDEGSSSIDEGSSSSKRSVFDALKLCLISRRRGVFTVTHHLRVSVVKDQEHQL